MLDLVFCQFWGDNFSPKKFEKLTGLELADKMEVGEPLRLGKFRNEPATYGMGNLLAPKPYEGEEMEQYPEDWLAEKLEQHAEAIQKSGVEEISVTVVFDEVDGMLNWEMSAKTMAIFGKVGAHLALTVYTKTSEPEEVEELVEV